MNTLRLLAGQGATVDVVNSALKADKTNNIFNHYSDIAPVAKDSEAT